jgi:hypothetical protein
MSATKGVKTETQKPSDLFRNLSEGLLVNSAEFAKITPTAQTKLLTENAGTAVMFVANFLDLSNRKLIRDKLLAGKDVSRELEFNGVVITDEERRVLNLITPILAKIEGIGPVYPWLPSADIEKASAVLTFKKEAGTERIYRSNGNYVSMATASLIWRKASKFWSGGKKPASNEVRANGSYYSNHACSYKDGGVSIGCQNITRAEVEAVARHYGWEPEVA